MMTLKTKKLLSVVIILFSCLSLISSPVRAEEPLTAVLPVREGDLSWKGFKRRDILNGITQQITNKLVNKDGIRVIERTRIEEIIAEQDLGQSGRLDPATAAEVGEILGVESVILGTLTRMEVNQKGEVSLGPFSAEQIKSTVTISGRIVNTTTAEIKSSFKGSGKASDTGFSISDLKGFSFGTDAFHDSVLGKSIGEATSSFVNRITAESLKKEAEVIIKGTVIKILDNKLIIDIGSEQGITEKQRGKLVRKVEVEEIDDVVSMPLGEVAIISVEEEAAVVKISNIEEGEEPKKGDEVHFTEN